MVSEFSKRILALGDEQPVPLESAAPATVSDAVAGVTSEAREVLQVSDAIDIFFKAEGTAEVVMLTQKHGSDMALEDMDMGNVFNAKTLLGTLLDRVPLERSKTLERQDIMETLIDKTYEETLRTKNASATSSFEWERLSIVSNAETERVKNGDKDAADTLIVQLLKSDLAGLPLEEAMKAALQRVARQDIDDEQRWIAETLLTIQKLPDAPNYIDTFAEKLEKMFHPSLIATAAKLRLHTATLRPLFTKHLTGSWETIQATFASQTDLAAIELALSECMRDISCIGCLLETANVMKEDRYSKVTFDEKKPRGYRKGWNMLHSKTGKLQRSHKWQRDGVPPDQTRNPSIPNDPVHALASANMSGKSWYLLQDLYLQACAQSFGYAPGLDVNIPRHEQLVLIDRASTNADRNLSAFGTEIDWWRKTLEVSEKGPTRIWSDEPFSTTGDIDQASLAAAVSDDLTERGHHIVFATHNERLMDHLEKERGQCISHFRTEVGAKDLVFTHKLEPGRDDSRALEVAAKFLDPRVIRYAKASLEGNPVHVAPLQNQEAAWPGRTLTAYSDEDRERLISEPKGFSQLFPDQLDVQIQRSRREKGTTRIMKPEGRDATFDHFDSLVHIASRDNDLHYHLCIPGTEHSQMGMAQSFLRSGVTNDVAELLERQRMWKELQLSENHSGIESAITTTWANLGAATCAYPDLLTGFNERLKEGATYLMRDAHMAGSDRVRAGSLPVFEKILQTLAVTEKWDPAFMETILQPVRQFFTLSLEWQHLLPGIYDEQPDGPNHRRILAIHQELATLVGAPEDVKLSQYAFIGKHLLPLIDRCTAQLPTVEPKDLATMDPDLLFSALNGTHEVTAKVDLFFPPPIIMQMKAMTTLTDKRPLESLSEALRQTDSVHLHRLGGYFSTLFQAYLDGKVTGRELLANMVERREDRHRYGDASHHSENFSPLADEMRQLMSLLEISKALKTQPFATAEYSANQEGHLTDVWNIAKPVEGQVRNSIILDPSAQVQIFTGANMSGKTYHMKAGFTAHLCAQSVGMAPAAEAKIPVRDAHCYIDRINAESSSGLSAFGTEMAVWGQFLASIKGKCATLCIDEFGSTTSPKYQGHLQYGLLQMLVEDGHTVFLTTHHHDSTERFKTDYPGITRLYHFPIQKAEGGLTYTYTKAEGIAHSQAIDVAEQQKFPARIIARARELEPMIAGG